MRRNLGHLNLASLLPVIETDGVCSHSSDELSRYLQDMNPISSDGVFENFRITACYNSKNLLDGPDDNIFDEFSVLDGSIVSRSEIVEKATHTSVPNLSSSSATISRANFQDIVKSSSSKSELTEPTSPHLGNTNLCVICHDFEKTVVLLPCRHLCLCTNCVSEVIVSKLSRCPLCRTQIDRTLSVFL